MTEQVAFVGFENDIEGTIALFGPRGETVPAPTFVLLGRRLVLFWRRLVLFGHQSVARPRYSPVRVSILTLSP